MEERTRSEILDRQLRVVIVAPRIEHLIGGQEVQAQLLLRLWRDDSALHISYVATNLALPEWLERIPILRTAARFPLYLAALLSELRQVDVVHIFSASFSSFLIATLPAYSVSRLLAKRVLINYRSGLARSHLNASPVAQRILRRADKVLVPSSYLVDVFREFGVSAEAISNVVDPTLFSYRSRAPLRPLLLCSRNLEPCYGIDNVLQAFAEVQKTFPEARLWLLGEGSQATSIRRLIADLKLTGVEMPGRVPRERIGHYYDQADILINASRVDNMPVSILEAFASGLSVVSTNVGGIPCIVRHGETGLLSNPDDPKQLAANAIRLLQDAALARCLTENARQQSSAYRWEEIRPLWLRIYQELGSGTPSTGVGR